MPDTPTPIILLEDDPALQTLLTEGLAEAGYRVNTVTTAEAAKIALAAVDGRALLVADRTLEQGGPNGFQVAAEALDQYPALRVIYVSGTHIAIRRRSLGTRERALLKPFAMSQLVAAVRDLV